MIQHEVQEELLARFLNYVRIDTESDPKSETYPSTKKQLVLLRMLHEELRDMGASDVVMDEYGYVTATIPATPGCETKPVIGLIAHVDTSPDLSGRDVQPQLIRNYDGGSIRLGESPYSLSLDAFPELSQFIGHDLITTDGTTLLGADDKAGVAEIMTVTEYLLKHRETLQHGKVRIAFTADEEIGRGVDFFNVEAFGADYAYTLDGSYEGELEYECFNACSVVLEVQGRNIHPGYAKGKMLNALQILCDLHQSLPKDERPECTEGYEGFYHLTEITGTVDRARASYIIRDHSSERFQERKDVLMRLVREMNDKLATEAVSINIQDQYYNMRDEILKHPQLISLAKEAMHLAGVTPIIKPIRGGTDGARLSFMGLPCPNLFAGGLNFHGRYEYVSLQSMARAVETVIHLLRLFAK